MKRFEFSSDIPQLYYMIKKSKYDTAYIVYILLKKPREVWLDNISKGLTNIVFQQPIDFVEEKKELVKAIFKDNAMALLNMNHETDGVIADISQFKISYKKEIKPWKTNVEEDRSDQYYFVEV